MPTKNKILVIGKDPELLRVMEQEFNDDDYDIVCTPHTGAMLREAYYNELPNFIILDIMMPTLDGIEVCLHLRQWTHTPIMMLSTWDADEGMVRGLNLCSERYLTEPFGMEALRTRIGDTLNQNYAVHQDPLSNRSGMF